MNELNEDIKSELKKRPINLRKIINQLTKSKGGLYPHEILMLNKVSRYKTNSENIFQWFWKNELGVDNPQDIINDLYDRGFVDVEDTKTTISRLTIPEIKEYLKEYGCKLTGSKTELLDRLFNECDVSTIGSKLTKRKYCLTDKGKQEIESEENEYLRIEYGSSSIYEMNILLYKHNPLNLSYKDFIWRRLLEQSEEELKNLDFGLYRSTRLDMSEQLRDKNKDKERLYYLCEVVVYDLSGLSNSYDPEFHESEYSIKSKFEFLFNTNNEYHFIRIAPAVVSEINQLRTKMKLEGLNFEEEVIKNLNDIKVYRNIFTPEERIEILFAELDENFEKLEEIYSIAKKRYKEYGKDLENGDENTMIEYYSKLNNVEKNIIIEYFDKLYELAEKRKMAEKKLNDERLNKWKLESDIDTFYEFDKKKIENEIDKLDTDESDWLVLEPPENIKGTIYIQVCIEVTEGDYRRKGENFHIELCFEDEEENLTSFQKDNMTKEEVLKIFIDYFENNNLPDIEDWYSVEL